eukprot:COSAG01_NODE_38287_length_491_cov_2.227041_1_plen_134_part_01
MLLHVFRSSRPDDSFIDPPLWSEIYKWEGVLLCGLAVLLCGLYGYGAPWDELAAFGGVTGISGLFMVLTVSSFESWALNLGCFILVSCWWIIPLLSISSGILDYIEEHNCRGRRAFLYKLAAIAVTAGWVVMMI